MTKQEIKQKAHDYIDGENMGKTCAYCNPDRSIVRDNSVLPILDTPYMTMCVTGHTPIANRRKMGQLQILNNVTGDVTYTEITHCPICGQPLYTED